MKVNVKKIFLKLLLILKWVFWAACVALFSFYEKLFFVIPFILAVASGLLLKKYVRRIPVFMIPAICVLIGNMFLLLLKITTMPASGVFLITDIFIVAGLLFWCMRKPSKPRIIVLMVYLVITFFLLDFRAFDAFDRTGQLNKLGTYQVFVKFFLWGFLIPGLRKIRKAFRSAGAGQGGAH